MMQVSTRLWVVLAPILLLAAAALIWRAGVAEQAPYATHTRPDGKFSIVVVKDKPWRPGMPGQGSDSPGEVRLLDDQGRVLARTPVDMVQLVEQVQWQDRRVVIKLIADWPLPE